MAKYQDIGQYIFVTYTQKQQPQPPHFSSLIKKHLVLSTMCTMNTNSITIMKRKMTRGYTQWTNKNQ